MKVRKNSRALEITWEKEAIISLSLYMYILLIQTYK